MTRWEFTFEFWAPNNGLSSIFLFCLFFWGGGLARTLLCLKSIPHLDVLFEVVYHVFKILEAYGFIKSSIAWTWMSVCQTPQIASLGSSAKRVEKAQYFDHWIVIDVPCRMNQGSIWVFLKLKRKWKLSSWNLKTKWSLVY